MKILAIGDVCGSLGCEAVRKWLPALKKEKKIDFTVINGGKKAIVTYGRLFSDALEAKAVCKDISIVKLNKIYPLSRELTDRLKEFNEIHFFEEGIRSGGIAELCAARLLEEGYGGIYKIHAVENRFVPTATVTGAIKACGLDTESMIAAVSEK